MRPGAGAPLPQPPGFPLSPVTSSRSQKLGGLIWEGGGGGRDQGATQACQVAGEAAAGKLWADLSGPKKAGPTDQRKPPA